MIRIIHNKHRPTWEQQWDHRPQSLWPLWPPFRNSWFWSLLLGSQRLAQRFRFLRISLCLFHLLCWIFTRWLIFLRTSSSMRRYSVLFLPNSKDSFVTLGFLRPRASAIWADLMITLVIIIVYMGHDHQHQVIHGSVTSTATTKF